MSEGPVSSGGVSSLSAKENLAKKLTLCLADSSPVRHPFARPDPRRFHMGIQWFMIKSRHGGRGLLWFAAFAHQHAWVSRGLLRRMARGFLQHAANAQAAGNESCAALT